MTARTPGPCDPACRNGWLGQDEAARPIPCPVCRPRTTRRQTRTRDDPQQQHLVLMPADFRTRVHQARRRPA